MWTSVSWDGRTPDSIISKLRDFQAPGPLAPTRPRLAPGVPDQAGLTFSRQEGQVAGTKFNQDFGQETKRGPSFSSNLCHDQPLDLGSDLTWKAEMIEGLSKRHQRTPPKAVPFHCRLRHEEKAEIDPGEVIFSMRAFLDV